MLDLDLIFNGANLFVLPFWLMMIVLPKWGLTQKVIASYLPFVPLTLLYLSLFILTLDPESAAAFSNPTLSVIAQLFSQEKIALTGWVHFIVLDFFVGRYIYLAGQRTGVWTIHSLILCLFAGPLGLLSHIVTTWIMNKDSQPEETQVI
ncbi:conserved hypothetical protein [Rippkaea orientalis PCC 8801]|uniref:DUF4281 domain-containing protein n=1 Tax=Rippkaea orientalis (strain PCC 8801 / RF-1) TaxID=41431 RepID=B7K366_RIPO1|nr:ABA4-like family protein [Rippkaea orientalis]ACK64386.1 conserved hypothetical protein [Rippkaea orientalis PCC 8801]